MDGEEYQVKAAVVRDLSEEVLLGRDVPLHRHMVKCLSKTEHLDLLRQLAKDNGIRLQDSMEGAMSVVTYAQKKRMEESKTENPSTRKETPITQEEILKTQERTPNTQERILTTQEETLGNQGKTQETLGTREETCITQTPEILKSQVDTKGRTGFIGDEYQFVEDLFEQPRRNKNYLT